MTTRDKCPTCEDQGFIITSLGSTVPCPTCNPQPSRTGQSIVIAFAAFIVAILAVGWVWWVNR